MVYLALAAITGYYIFQRFTVLDVAAIALFIVFLMGAGFVAYPKAFFALKKEVEKTSGAEILKQNWITVLIWAGFARWVLATIFGI